MNEILPEVLPTNERMTYSVASRRREGKRYRVDLLHASGAGYCSCFDFGIRKQPNLDAGFPPMTTDTTCYHLRAAQRAFLLELLKAMADSEEQR
jgi:hypothetical protein